jgi:hypothetical protein
MLGMWLRFGGLVGGGCELCLSVHGLIEKTSRYSR